jgi:CRP-like cAMP-binding protein
MSQEPTRRLDGIRLLSKLPPEALSEIAQRCRWREYPADAEILDRDSEDRDVYFVVRGGVQIVNYSLSGRKIALARIEAGSYFGELAAIDGHRRSAGVVALEDCLVATMTPKAFDQMVLDHSGLAMHLLQRLARIIRACDDRIMDLSTLGAVQRVYIELLGLADRDPAGSDAWVIWPVPAQREIASQASTTRETVTRAISQLVAEGVVTRKGKSLYIHDRARLENLASGLAADWGEDGVR